VTAISGAAAGGRLVARGRPRGPRRAPRARLLPEIAKVALADDRDRETTATVAALDRARRRLPRSHRTAMRRFLLWLAAFMAVIGLAAALRPCRRSRTGYVASPVPAPLRADRPRARGQLRPRSGPGRGRHLRGVEVRPGDPLQGRGRGRAHAAAAGDGPRAIADRTGGTHYTEADPRRPPTSTCANGCWYLRHPAVRSTAARATRRGWRWRRTNAGQANVDEWIRGTRRPGSRVVIPFPETRAYIDRVLHLRDPLPAGLQTSDRARFERDDSRRERHHVRHEIAHQGRRHRRRRADRLCAVVPHRQRRDAGARTSPSSCGCSRSRRAVGALTGVGMELDDCAFPTLRRASSRPTTRRWRSTAPTSVSWWGARPAHEGHGSAPTCSRRTARSSRSQGPCHQRPRPPATCGVLVVGNPANTNLPDRPAPNAPRRTRRAVSRR